MEGLTKAEYDIRETLFAIIEGYYGTDDGFSALQTKTLFRLAYATANDLPTEARRQEATDSIEQLEVRWRQLEKKI